MKKAFVVAGRDFRSLVTSPMFFVVSGLTTLILSFIYLRSLFEFQRMSIMGGMPFGRGGETKNIYFDVFTKHISITNLLFIAIVPALTMRLLAEEKKVRTYDLLLTSPITATDIALGKFLAAFAAAMLLTGLSLIYPLGTRAFVEFNISMLLIGYAGLALVVATYVAIGVFASSITESIALAVILGWVFNLGLWFFAAPDMFEASWANAVMEHLSLPMHFQAFILGMPKLAALVFFLSGIGFFVFLTQRVVESSRWR